MPVDEQAGDSLGSPVAVVPAGTASAVTDRRVVLLFGAALLSGALLMFLLEPMAAKMVLPSLGGAPAVWNTCVVFFQGMLLAGYAYAHGGPRWLGVRRHATLHVMLLLASVLTLRSPFPMNEAAGASSPVAWLLLALLQSIGLPFFLLATTAPLLQKWFSHTRHRSAGDPYFLYAASNVGSLAGLLMYPLVVEPFLPLRLQSRYWIYGYMGFVLVVTACTVLLRRAALAAEGDERPSRTAAGRADLRPGSLRRLRWVALSFAPASLMLAVTTFISTDVAAVPLLWVLPLGLYLLTFVLAFSWPPRYPRAAVDRALPLLILPLVLLLVLQVTGPLIAVVPVHVAVFFLAALVCHRQLADDRPDPAHLTEFYLLVALGGVLGSLFNTLAAPVLFTGIVEYPAVLLLVCLLRDPPAGGGGQTKAWRVGAPVIAGIATIGILLASSGIDSTPLRFALLGIPAFLCLSVSRTRVPFAAALAGMLAASAIQPDPLGRVLHAERTFFGTYKVRLEPGGEYRTLTHGTTLHGIQSVAGVRRAEPLSYYHPSGPLGDVFRFAPLATAPGDVAVVGLGVGSVATYRKPQQVWTFFEIDPAVEAVARRQDFFTYLTDCGGACRVVIGDARQSLAASRALYSLMVVDAFSSDAIPLHLLTREAVDLYLARLAPAGVLAFHVSNRHLDLEPVLARLAAEAGLVSFIRRHQVPAGDESGRRSSDWLVMARSADGLGPLAADAGWTPSRSRSSVDLWTDDFSNVFTLLVRK